MENALVVGLGLVAGACAIGALAGGHVSGAAAWFVVVPLLLMVGCGLPIIFSNGLATALSMVKGGNSSFATGLFFGGSGLAFAGYSTLSMVSGTPKLWLVAVLGTVAALATWWILGRTKEE